MVPGHDDTFQRSSSIDILPRLRAATREINENSNLEEILQRAIDYSCSMTDARFGVLFASNHQRGLDRHFFAGTSAETLEHSIATLGRSELNRRFSRLPAPLRNFDLGEYADDAGLTDLAYQHAGPCLAVPVRYRDENLGNVLLGKGAHANEFDQADEDVVGIIASHAALAIATAQRRSGEKKTTGNFDALMNALPVGVVTFNLGRQNPFSYNREAARIVGPLKTQDQPVEFLQRILNVDLADGCSISLESQPIEEIIAAVEDLRDEEIVLSVPDGRSVKVLVNAAPVHSAEGDVVSAVFALQDMSPIEELEQLRADFLAMVGQELREPLTSIKGSTATLLSSMKIMDPVEVVEFVKIIDSNIDQMRDRIGSLVDVARAETGTISVTTSPTDPIALIDEVRRDYFGDGAQVSVVADIDADLPWVLADKRRIGQVFGNLLSIAYARSFEASSMQITVSRRDAYVEFTIAGHGSPFHSSAALRAVGEQSLLAARGFGVELALCRGLIEAQGGRIWAESEGSGSVTRFTITLPAVDQLSPAPTADLNVLSEGFTRSEISEPEILVVDEDPQTLRYVRDNLRIAGYRPTVTSDPNQALRICEIDRPDLVLLDLTLPGVDVVDLMSRMFRIAKVPIIFLSVYGKDESVAQAIEAGAYDYMTKPFAPTELLARVDTALRRKSKHSLALPDKPFVGGDLKIDFDTRRVTVGDQMVSLTATEYKLLSALSQQAGRVIPHDDLLFRVWGPTSRGDLATLRTFIRRLRRKLGDDANSPRYIFVEPRVGYRMLAPEARTDI